jgi:hypothetical protein
MALEAIRKYLEEGTKIVLPLREVSHVNERFVEGDQFSALNYRRGRPEVIEDAWFEDEFLPRVSINKLGPLTATLTSLLAADRPCANAVPNSDEPSDVYSAAVADRVIDWYLPKVKSSEVVSDSINYAAVGGTGGIKVLWDNKLNRVSWSAQAIDHFVVDPNAPDVQNGRYVCFVRYIPVDEANDWYSSIGLEKSASPEAYTNAAGEQLQGVKVEELWLKNCRDWPQGLFASSVGGELVEQMDFPNTFIVDKREQQILPLFTMKMRPVRDSAYGSTPVTNCVPLQRTYNEMFARDLRQVRIGVPHLKIPRDLIEGLNLTTSTIIPYDRSLNDQADDIVWTVPPQLDPQREVTRDKLAAEMPMVLGLNEVTAGKARTLSGIAIDGMVELDRQRHAAAAKSMQNMVVGAWYLTLLLDARYRDVQDTMDASGSSQSDVLQYKADDINGSDWRLEPGSEFDRLAPEKVRIAGEQVQAGTADNSDLQKAKRSPAWGLSVRSVEQLVDQVLQGIPVEALPGDIDPAAAKSVIDKAKSRALANGNRQAWVMLDELLKSLQSMAPQAAEQAPIAPPEEQQVMNAPV